MGYSSLVVQSISWLGFFRVITRVISFLRVIVLARILVPSQFGAYSVAHLLLLCIDIITETGVNVFLIQEKEKIDKYIDSAWVVSLVRGFIIGIVLFFSAPFIARFFNSTESIYLIQLMSFVPIIKGFINPSIVKFQKELEFNKEFWLRTAIFAVDSSVAVILTYVNQNASGIVWGLIAGGLTEVVLSWIFIRPTPRFVLHTNYIGQLFHRGKWVTMSGIFTYLFQNGDNIVVGRILGTSSLGLYQMAYSLSILPISEVTDVFSKVAFPLYAKIADDKKRLKNAFLKIFFVSVALALPISCLLFLFPQQIITMLLGEKWVQAADVLKVLALFGIIRSISISPFPLFLALGKQQYVTTATFVSIVVFGISIMPLVYLYGMVGAAYAVIMGSSLSLPIVGYYTAKVLSNRE